MQDFIQVTGIILKQTPIGEYDRRICLLTKEKGKISKVYTVCLLKYIEDIRKIIHYAKLILKLDYGEE